MQSHRFARLRTAALGAGMAALVALTACSGSPDTPPTPGGPIPLSDQTNVELFSAKGQPTGKQCTTIFGGTVVPAANGVYRYNPPVTTNVPIQPNGPKVSLLMTVAGTAGASQPRPHKRIEQGVPCVPGVYIKLGDQTLKEAPGLYKVVREEYRRQREDIATLLTAEGKLKQRPRSKATRLQTDNGTVAMLNLRPIKLLGVIWAFWSECALRRGGTIQPVAQVGNRAIWRYQTEQTPRTVEDCPSGTLYDTREGALGQTRDLAPLYN